jgi:predicted phage terminase large subunit-like protein
VALARLAPHAVVVVVQTRWHEDDLAGRVLAGPDAREWRVVSLPALSEGEGDLLGRPEGAPLWSDRFPLSELEARRAGMSERSWLALYQQRPSSEEGNLFRREWMCGTWRELPLRHAAGSTVAVVQAVDSAFKTGVGNNWSVITTWMADAAWLYLADVWWGRVEYPQLLRAVEVEAAEWRPDAILIEDTAAGQSAVQSLRQTSRLPVVAVKPEGSKVSRAEAVSPLFEAVEVLLPAARPAWLEPWVEEHANFPRGRHDDQVDTTSLALARLRELSLASARASVGGDTDLLDSLGSPPWGESGRLEASITAGFQF